MSIRIMSEVFEKSKTEGNARLVLLALADACNDDACCWPSIRKLSAKANLSEPITKKYLSAFIRIGLVEREDRMDKNGRQTSNLYTIKKEKIGEDFLTKEIIDSCTPSSRINHREGLTPVSGGGANSSYPVEGLTPVSGSYMNRLKESLKESSCGCGSEVSEEFASMVTPEPEHELFAELLPKKKSGDLPKREKLEAFKTRACGLMGRRTSTAWSVKELRLCEPHLDTTDEDWKYLEAYYANRGKKDFYCRKNMETLLNNWAGEIDKSREHALSKEKTDWDTWKPNE